MAHKHPQRFCIFCGGPGLSGEHVFPNWLRAHVPRPSTRTQHEITLRAGLGRLNELRRFKAVRPGVLDRPGDPSAQRLRVVCRRCNNEWMSGLQARAKPFVQPLVLGKPVTWTPEARSTLAAWVAMTALVIEQGSPPIVISTAEERAAFMREPQPPTGWVVWVGRCVRTVPPRVHHTGGNGRAIVDPVPGQDRMRFLSVTFAIRHLVAHVRYVSGVGLPQEATTVRVFRELGLVPIWPLSEDDPGGTSNTLDQLQLEWVERRLSSLLRDRL